MRTRKVLPVGATPASGPRCVPSSQNSVDHRVVRVTHGDQLVALIRERRARVLEVLAHGRVAVVHLPRRDDLVARVREGLHHGLEVVDVLGLHVLAHHGLTSPA